MLGLKSQKCAKETTKFLVWGLERSENQKPTVPSDPLNFEILVALKKNFGQKKMEKAKQKSCVGLHLLRIFWLLQSNWTAHRSPKFFWSIFSLHLGWHSVFFKRKNVGNYQKSKNKWRKVRIDWNLQFPGKTVMPHQSNDFLEKVVSKIRLLRL